MRPKPLAGFTAGRDLAPSASPCPEGRADQSIDTFLIAVNASFSVIRAMPLSRAAVGYLADTPEPVEILGQIEINACADALVDRDLQSTGTGFGGMRPPAVWSKPEVQKIRRAERDRIGSRTSMVGGENDRSIFRSEPPDRVQIGSSDQRQVSRDNQQRRRVPTVHGNLSPPFKRSVLPAPWPRLIDGQHAGLLGVLSNGGIGADDETVPDDRRAIRRLEDPLEELDHQTCALGWC